MAPRPPDTITPDFYVRSFVDPELAAQTHATLDHLEQAEPHPSTDTKGGSTR